MESVLIPISVIGISTLFAYRTRGLCGQRAGFSGCVDKCPVWGVEFKVMETAVMVRMTGIRRGVKMA